MSNQCCICDKEITGIETFGSVHFPVCYRCFCRFTQELNEIDQTTYTTLQVKKIEELRKEVKLPEARVKEIKELESKILNLEFDIDDLKDEIWGKKCQIDDLKERIASIKKGALTNETN